VRYDKDYDAIADEGPWHSTRHASRCWKAAASWPSCGTFESPQTLDATMLVLRCSNGSKRGQLHGCRLLKIETQNTNVQACRSYERQGCRLEAIHRAAYPELRGDPTALVQGSTALSRSIWTTGC